MSPGGRALDKLPVSQSPSFCVLRAAQVTLPNLQVSLEVLQQALPDTGHFSEISRRIKSEPRRTTNPEKTAGHHKAICDVSNLKAQGALLEALWRNTGMSCRRSLQIYKPLQEGSPASLEPDAEKARRTFKFSETASLHSCACM